MSAPTTPHLLERRERSTRSGSHPRLQLDVPLLARYERPWMDNALYPGVARMSREFGATQLRQHVERSNGDLIPRQLSLQVHLPHCLNPDVHRSVDCTVAHDMHELRAYLENLRREVAAVGQLFDRDRSVIELHLGGGTPSVLPASELEELLDSLAHHFQFSHSSQRDFSITLDPALVQDHEIAAYAALGLNQARLATSVVAVRGFDSGIRHVSRQSRPLERLLKTIDSCHANGFRSVRLDVLYEPAMRALPGFDRLLDLILAARPDQLTFCKLATSSNSGEAAADRADAYSHWALLAVAAERLEATGYEPLGLDNFVVPGSDLLQAQHAGTLNYSSGGYTAHSDCDRVGLGVGAISHICDSVSQNHTDATQWKSALDAGHLPVARGFSMDFDDIVRKDVIQQVLCQGRIDIAATETRHYISFAEYFVDALRRLHPLIEDRVVECNEQFICTTSRGRPMLRMIAACFDRYAT